MDISIHGAHRRLPRTLDTLLSTPPWYPAASIAAADLVVVVTGTDIESNILRYRDQTTAPLAAYVMEPCSYARQLALAAGAAEAISPDMGAGECSERLQRIAAPRVKQDGLTRVESKVLSALLARPGHTVSRQDLYLAAIGKAYTPYDRTLDTHIYNLRRKITASGDITIHSIRGVGYAAHRIDNS